MNQKFQKPILILFLAICWLVASTVSLINQSKPVQSHKPQVLGITDETPRDPAQKARVPMRKEPFNVNAQADVLGKAYLVVDNQTQTILLEKSPNLKLPIASITKLLTALTAYEHLDPMENYLTPNIEQHYQIRPTLNLKPGQTVFMLDLLKSSLVCSANDSAQALALITEAHTQQKFVDLMNQTAQNIGMVNSHFSNALGFDSQYNYSTASDLLKLAKFSQNISAIKQLGKHKGVAFSSVEGQTYFCKSSNKLISESEEFENLKTGWTENSGGSMIVKAKNNQNEVLIILLNSPQREKDVKQLAELAFSQFYWDLEK